MTNIIEDYNNLLQFFQDVVQEVMNQCDDVQIEFPKPYVDYHITINQELGGTVMVEFTYTDPYEEICDSVEQVYFPVDKLFDVQATVDYFLELNKEKVEFDKIKYVADAIWNLRSNHVIFQAIQNPELLNKIVHLGGVQYYENRRKLANELLESVESSE